MAIPRRNFRIEREEPGEIESAFSIMAREVDRYPLLTAEEEKAYLQAAKKGQLEARNKLVLHNLRLIIQIAYGFWQNWEGTVSVSLLELVQEGSLGLIEAVERFKFERGCRLSTLAYPLISKQIQRYLEREKKERFGQPLRAQWELRSLDKARRKFPNHEPSLEALQAITGFSERTLRRLQRLEERGAILSLDEKIGGEGDVPRLTLIADPGAADPGQMILREALIKFLGQVLKPRQKEVIVKHFGLEDGSCWSLAKIGRELKPECHREWIRQLKIQALRILQEPQNRGVLSLLLQDREESVPS